MKKVLTTIVAGAVLVVGGMKAVDHVDASLDKQHQIQVEQMEVRTEERVAQYCDINPDACTGKTYEELVEITK